VSDRNTKKSRIISNSTLLLALAIGSFLPSSAQTTFQIRSFDGTRKCLDYAIQSPYHVDAPVANQPSSQSSATVFLNDCANAHPIVIEELQNGRHEVVLHAGNKVIGIGQVTVIGGHKFSSGYLLRASARIIQPKSYRDFIRLRPCICARRRQHHSCE
jgi:hypothetical protein